MIMIGSLPLAQVKATVVGVFARSDAYRSR
jgi:hypothetical protein